MKPLFANRMFQWILLIVFCSYLALMSSLILHKAPKLNDFATTKTIPLSNQVLPENSVQTSDQTQPSPLSHRIVEYHIAVSLIPEQKMLEGTETVSWENPGKKPVSEIYFHLYPNAFESTKTSFNRESGGKLREDKMTSASNGWMKLQSFETTLGQDLMSHLSFVQPDDGNTNDHTLMKVRLSDPIGPGEKISFTMKFSVKLPYVYARMGYADDFYMAGQWFPKIAVYEPAGTRGRLEEGWNLHQYHGNSEFYADFGIYDVSIQVPSAYIVAATGFPVNPAAEKNNRKTYHFYADDVHDFAWSASPNFVYYEEPFSTPNVPGVKIKLYLDPSHKNFKTRYMQAAKKALTRYSEWYGAYPYSTLSIVVPPENGNGAGGMEYPTLITAWGTVASANDLSLERVVVHEIGHQFWYGMVASNEFEEAWLDEGFTSYAEDKVMEREYGSKPNLPLEASYVTSPESLKLNSWEYGHHGQYAENVYTRAKLVLNSIEKDVGPELMQKTLKAYFQQWKFRHPSTQDFQAILEKTTQKSWKPFFDSFVYGGLMIDYTVDNIHIRKTTEKNQTSYTSEVLIRKQGGSFPNVPIHFHFSDGTSIDKVWNSESNDTLFKLIHTSPVDWVRIDPEHKMLMENKHINNFMKTNIDPTATIRWNTSFLKILETLFNSVSW
ncbi:M1 family peptidase [Paenibacillus psychroresistens]|uniref:M1 family peptidase n=1 Tax=Paenibacillus psychroresistens TaxID=1778678 RepID=A0A6B8RS61_9BACL|nr:M1 family metallopeptidase [Paenibacillus psychroresistens]QGQ99240.1 M1 family peptidase [Paenibacillus psychroresistens]